MEKLEFTNTSSFPKSLFFTSSAPDIDPNTLNSHEKEEFIEAAAASLTPSQITTLASELSKPNPNTERTLVTPIPGFLVKTQIITVRPTANAAIYQNSHLIYVNICHASEIPAPPDVPEREIQRALNAQDGATYQIPLSLSDRRPDESKKIRGHIFDACVNTKPYLRAERDLDFRLYVIELAFEFIEDREGVEVSREFDMPNKLRLRGNALPSRWVQIPKGERKLISEVEEVKSKNTKESESKRSAAIAKPTYKIETLTPQTLLVTIHSTFLTRNSLPSFVALDIEPAKVLFTYAHDTVLEIALPKEIDLENALNRAQFVRKKGIVKVLLVVKEVET